MQLSDYLLQSILKGDVQIEKRSDGSLKVEYDFGVSHRHWFELKQDQQILHNIATERNPSRYPSLNQFIEITEYLILLHRLSEITTRPTREQMKKAAGMCRWKKRPLKEILALLYGQRLSVAIRATREALHAVQQT